MSLLSERLGVTYRGLRGSPLRVWLTIAGFLLLMAIGVGLVASGIIPGVPDLPQKTVSLYSSPQTDTSPLTLYLQPPASTLEVGAAGQVLALQFSNRSTNAAQLSQVIAEPHTCFALRPLESQPGVLPAGKTVVSLYRLTVPGGDHGTDAPMECHAQEELTLRYSYTWSAQAGAAGQARGEGFISTSPISITTARQLWWERVFRMAGLLAVPLLLAIVGFYFQEFQTRKADQQKDESLRLEVWKIVFPIVNGLNNKYYVQMARKAGYAKAEASAAKPNGRSVTAALVLLRAANLALYKEQGGFSFRNLPAEDLCYALSQQLWGICQGMLDEGDQLYFDEFAACVLRRDTIGEAANKLDARAAQDAELRKRLELFQQTVILPIQQGIVIKLLDAFGAILEFECNTLLYPEWYQTPPVLNFSKLSLEGMEFQDKERQEHLAVVGQYKKLLPRECRG